MMKYILILSLLILYVKADDLHCENYVNEKDCLDFLAPCAWVTVANVSNLDSCVAYICATNTTLPVYKKFVVSSDIWYKCNHIDKVDLIAGIIFIVAFCVVLLICICVACCLIGEHIRKFCNRKESENLSLLSSINA